MERRLDEDTACTDVVKYLQALLGHAAPVTVSMGRSVSSAVKGSLEGADAEPTPEEGQRRRRR